MSKIKDQLISQIVNPKLAAILTDVQAGRLSVDAAVEAIEAAGPTVKRAMLELMIKEALLSDDRVYADSELLRRIEM